jgi:hypothetical protein
MIKHYFRGLIRNGEGISRILSRSLTTSPVHTSAVNARPVLSDDYEPRHIGPQDADVSQMLSDCGAKKYDRSTGPNDSPQS